MKMIDLRSVSPGQSLEADVCIVGSGPAAFAIAAELAQTRFRVLVVESGAEAEEAPFTTDLNAIESVGEARVMDQRLVRNRVLGGSSHTWSGRCTTLDAMDLAVRPWVPFSGWPITHEELREPLQQAAGYLGLAPMDYDPGLLADLKLPTRFDTQEAGLRSVFWQFSRQTSSADHVRFGTGFGSLAGEHLRVVTHATVTQIVTDENGSRVIRLRVSTPERIVHTIESRTFVLCAGGIENARLLLASNQVAPSGIGNRKGLVGRFFMDHPRTVIGRFDASAANAIRNEFFLLRHSSGVRLQRGLTLAPEIQQREALLNCAAWVTQHFHESDVWHALRRERRRRPRNPLPLGAVALRHADQILQGAWNRFVRRSPLPRRYQQIEMDVLVEQTPDPNSRIRLSETRDFLGIPLSQIDWKIGALERETVLRLAHGIDTAMTHLGLPRMQMVDWVRRRDPGAAIFRDVAHPIGATRMAATEEYGVVNADGRVFGVGNLYVAGSSVFPTSGHANPTLMIVALAVRLAGHLRREALPASA